jgi:RHS repeat-associated protein
MEMPGRDTIFKTGYRYGFNGKEMDNDTYGGQGNEYDYGMRIYNPRIGNFLSIDPLQTKYTSEAPYIYAGRNPIFMIDDGGKKKTTFYIVIDDRTGKTSIRQVQTKDLYKVRVDMANRPFGISTHDTHTEYEWYDITSLNVTHIDKNGKVTKTNITNNTANLEPLPALIGDKVMPT